MYHFFNAMMEEILIKEELNENFQMIFFSINCIEFLCIFKSKDQFSMHL